MNKSILLSCCSRVPNTNSYHQLWILIPRLQLIAQVQNQDIVLDPMDIDILVLDLSFDFDELNRALKDRRQSERDTIKVLFKQNNGCLDI